EETIREPARRGAGIEAITAAGIDREAIERRRQLATRPGHEGPSGACQLDGGVQGDERPRLGGSDPRDADATGVHGLLRLRSTGREPAAHQLRVEAPATHRRGSLRVPARGGLLRGGLRGLGALRLRLLRGRAATARGRHASGALELAHPLAKGIEFLLGRDTHLANLNLDLILDRGTEPLA